MAITASAQFGHYRILTLLGAGGMGEIYLAEDTRLDRRVALKILPEVFATDAERMRRFIQEAKAASALNHPNILTIHEIGETDGKRYIATEFIEGETLRHHIQHSRMKIREVLEVTAQVASALSAAHQAGIIHRDIKPENIMLRPDGYVKVLDFGLAKLTEKQAITTDSDAATVSKKATDPGTIMGTVQYMSPEQARGKEVDARSDIFSLGVVLYEMIAGRAPFAGESSTDVLAAILDKEPLPLLRFVDDLPQELQRIVQKCLRKERDERYQTMKDVLLDLKELRDELALEAKLERSIGPASRSTVENQQTLISEAEITKGQSAQATSAASVQTTSSAEYLVSEIKKHKRGAVAALVVLLAAAAALGYWLFGNRAAVTKQIESIAVMPFVNESGNSEVEYLSDGMTEALIRSLSQLPNLNVKARSSVFRYKGKEIDAKTIGRELNVQAILNGRVIQRGEQLTLNLELIDSQTENVIWTDQYDRKSSDLVSLQNLIARDVSSKFKIQLSGADLEKLAKNYTNDPEAYRLYLQGRFYWNKRVGKEFERAEGYFRQAVERDPNFALGYVGLADFQEDNDRPRKKEYIRRALEIDDRLAEAHASLGYQYMVDYNWAESERELKRAIELNPNYPQAHQWNGMRLMMNGKYDEARVSLTRALELDPTSPGINFYYCVLLEVSGRINESIQQTKKLIEMEPAYSWAYIQLARVYRLNGNHEGCVEVLARNSDLNGNEERAKAIRESFAKGGWKGFLRETFEASPFGASSLAELGEYEKAIEAIVKQSERDTKFWFFMHRTDPFLDPIRDDPRFKEAMKQLDPPQ
jgi:serine/threonine-protein kinase